MKKIAICVSLTALVAVVIVATRGNEAPAANASSTKANSPPSLAIATTPLSLQQPHQSRKIELQHLTTDGPTIRQKMKISKDWYALAKESLPLAKAGDPEAQYVLFVTYRYCFDSSGVERTKRDTLDAVREFAVSYDLPVDSAVSHFQQCHGFNTEDAASLGDPWEWLQKATDAGYAPAQALTAHERLFQDQMKAFMGAGARPTDPAAYRAPIGGDIDPRELLVVAAQSADPEILAEIGGLQHMLNPDQPRDVTRINSVAWRYVGCQRAGDCSMHGPTIPRTCGPNDGKCVGVPESLQREVDYNWAPVQEQVNQINKALDTKQWAHLPGLTTAGG